MRKPESTHAREEEGIEIVGRKARRKETTRKTYM
jgi:hypothetical protein